MRLHVCLNLLGNMYMLLFSVLSTHGGVEGRIGRSPSCAIARSNFCRIAWMHFWGCAAMSLWVCLCCDVMLTLVCRFRSRSCVSVVRTWKVLWKRIGQETVKKWFRCQNFLSGPQLKRNENCVTLVTPAGQIKWSCHFSLRKNVPFNYSPRKTDISSHTNQLSKFLW